MLGLVRSTPVYTSSPALSRARSVRPSQARRPPLMGTMSVVVLPTSTRMQSSTREAANRAEAIQFVAANSSGRERASGSAANSPRLSSTNTGFRGNASRTPSITNRTPSRLLLKASESSAVMVSASGVSGSSASSPATSMRTPGSRSRPRHTSNGRTAVRTAHEAPARDSTRAALTWTPPTSQPTVTSGSRSHQPTPFRTPRGAARPPRRAGSRPGRRARSPRPC